MPVQSAGILMFRRTGDGIELLLAHPGGPFWAKKDEGAWSIPKGLVEPGEDPEVAARREFEEETGHVPQGSLINLGQFKQKSGKTILAYAVEGDFDPATLVSNVFSMDWPPRSGRTQEFPEVDRAAWFSPGDAARRILVGQQPIIEALLQRLL